ncbi:MAG: hypothetical protein ACFFG0_07590, partial [Candidatus Thorarchaeota archaeon]
MKLRKNMEGNSHAINLILLAVSFIVIGVLSIIFITQMELHPGWAWEDLSDIYPMELTCFETEDVNERGTLDIISYSNIRGTDRPEEYPDMQYGGVYCIEGANGKIIWQRDYNGPVKKVFPLSDVDNDGNIDYFVSQASVAPYWQIQNGVASPKILPDLFTNQIINGSNGHDLIGYKFNYTNFYVHDLIQIGDLSDPHEDLIFLECDAYENTYENNTWLEYDCYLTSYFLNGTKTNNISVYVGEIHEEFSIPQIQLFQHYGESQLLYIDFQSIILLNLSTVNFLNPIYNNSLIGWFDGYTIIEDLNLDGISEILLYNTEGNITLINGADGGTIREFEVSFDFPSLSTHGSLKLKEVHSAPEDGSAFLLLTGYYWFDDGTHQQKIIQAYSLNSASQEVLWEVIKHGSDVEVDFFVLDEDLNGDSIDEIIFYERHEPMIAFGEINRYTIMNFLDRKKYAIVNIGYSGDSVVTINDFDGDGKKDFIISGDDRIIALSTSKPLGLWLSPAFPLGLPLFIILVILLSIGIIIVALFGKKLSYKRRSIGKHKLTVVVNAIAITLISITFMMFLLLMNIFNNTLITGTNNTKIVLVFLIVTIIWYGTLPLTAALYNQFAPQFAYVFVKLRDMFFKISKGYRNEIIILDMKDRKDIGLTFQLKRMILPLLLAISVGFYCYDTLSSLFGYPKTFEVFGSTEFFDFMMGYMLGCVLPMILSFALFSVFISGNYLLYDAGVVYYREHMKYRQPADIEPISIWAQSIVKGIAGLSALLTFSGFLFDVDFSGFFGEGDLFNFVFGIFIVIVMFGGIPFFTGFSYVLLAG